MGEKRTSQVQRTHDAVLKAALRLVTKKGYQAVSVNQIAREAGVGKMTLYRHWSNKAGLVMESLLFLIGSETDFPESGTAIERIRHQLDLQAAFFRSSRGTLIRSLVAEAQSDSELAIAFRENWLNPRRDGVRRMMQLAIAEGSLRADIDVEVAIDLLYGAFYYRLLLGWGLIDEAFVERSFLQFLRGHEPFGQQDG